MGIMKDIVRNAMQALFYLSVLYMPIQGSIVMPYSTQIFLIIAILFCFCAFVYFLLEGKFWDLVKREIWFALFFGIMFTISTVKYVISILNQQGITFFTVYQMVIFAAYGCLSFAIMADNKKTMTVAVGIYSVMTALLVIGYPDYFLYDLGVYRFIGAYTNPNGLGLFSVIGFFCSLYMIVARMPLKWLWVCNSGINLAALLLTGSRSAVLSLGIGAVLCILLVRYVNRASIKRLAVTVCVLCCVAVCAFGAIMPSEGDNLQLIMGSELEATEQTEAPAVTEQTEAPAVTEQTEAPAVTEQTEAPAVTEQTEAPAVTEQTEAPTVTEQIETPAVTEPEQVQTDAMNESWNRFMDRFSGASIFSNLRVQIWIEYARSLPEYYLFGTDYTLEARPILYGAVRDSHNTIIYTIFRFGIFGLMSLVTMLLVVGCKLLFRKQRTPEQVVILATFAAVMVASLMADYLNRPSYYLIIAFAYAAIDDQTRYPFLRRDKTKRVLQVFSTLNKGGAESRTMDIFRCLGNDICFDFAVTGSNPQEHYFYEEIIQHGGNVYEIHSWKQIGLIEYFRQWTQLFRENRYEIVHCHAGVFAAIPMYVAALNDIPLRIAHARDSSADKNNGISIKINRIVTNLFCNCRIFCSEEAAEFAFGVGKDKKNHSYFLPNATDLNKFSSITEEDRNRLKKKLKFPEHSVVLGTVGNARPVKNHIFLTKVFHKYLEIDPRALLVIVGKNEQDIDVKAYVKEHGISDRVVFTGPQDDVHILLQLFDVFVLPSLHEGAPGSVIEAQAANVPCVLSDSITRAVDVGTGLVKYISLSDSMETWVSELQDSCNMERQEFGVSIKILSEAGYNVADSKDRLLDIYRNA